MECFVLLNPSTPEFLAFQTVSSTVHLSFLSVPLAGQQFFISANYSFYAVTVFIFIFVGYAVTVSKISELVMQLQFFS